MPDADIDGTAVGLDQFSGGCPGSSIFADDAKATQIQHVLPSYRADNASCECAQISEKADSDTTRQSEEILLDIFVRRALSAGDEMDIRVDSIRDAIRKSDSSSAWFTR